MRKYYIYKATNRINGKSYVGQSVHPLERISQHVGDRRNTNSIFHKAIDKYGIGSFDWTILVKVDGKDMANKAEKHYIKTENTYKPNGYNMTKGGDGGSMWNAIPVVCLTKDGEFIKRYDSASESRKDGFYGSDVLDSCRNIHKTCKGRIFMFEADYLKNGGRKWSKPMPNHTRAIIQCDLRGNMIKRFQSIAEAEKELNIGHNLIVSCAVGRYKQSHGFIFVYEEDFPIKDIDSRKHKKKGHKVAKVDKNTGEILQVYERMSDAARELGGSHKLIHRVVDEPNKTAYGYRWISQ
jgi:group I intron endonuclease